MGTSYTDYRDSQGSPMPWMSQEVFTAGEIIDVKHLYTTHHYGHIQVRTATFELVRQPPLFFSAMYLRTNDQFPALRMQRWAGLNPRVL